jgi:hypothetical protein
VTLHVTATAQHLDGDGHPYFLVTFTEDVSAVPFATDGLDDVDAGLNSTFVAHADAHNIQWAGDYEDDYGQEGDFMQFAPIPGYAFSPVSFTAPPVS